MRAVVLDAPGPPSALAIRELPVPVPSAGQVLIRVRAFGLNRLELYLRLGLSEGVTFPRVPGIEATGVVEACPGGEFRAGQQVAALMGGMGRAFDGGYADYTCVPAAQVIPFRSDLDWATLGAVPEMLQTSYGSLTTGLDARPGQSILIRGGTSSVGLATAVLARQRGMTVLATTRNPGRPGAVTEGRRRPCAHRRRRVAAGPRDRPRRRGRRARAGRGRRCRTRCERSGSGVVCFTGMLSNLDRRDFYPIDYLPTGVRLTAYNGDAADLPPRVLQDFLDAVAAGPAVVPIGRVYRLDQIVEAHTDMEQNRVSGKLHHHDMRRASDGGGANEDRVLGAGPRRLDIRRLWHAAGHDITSRRGRRPAAGTGGGTRGASTRGLGRRRRGERRSGARGRPSPRCDRRAAGSRPGRWPRHDRRGQLLRAATAVTAVAGRRVPAGALGARLQLAHVNVMADDNHREPPWVLFLSGDEEAKPAVAQLIRDAGFDPVDLGGIDDSQLQDPGSALWTYTLTRDEATALVARIKSGDTAAADPTHPADRAIREVPRPCTRRSRVLPRAPVARGLRGRDLAGR